MSKKDQLYDAFAELVYAIVMADGVADAHEKETLTELLKGHPLANYLAHYFEGREPGVSIAQSYKHTMDLCRENGPDAEYPFLIRVLEAIAEACHFDSDQEETIVSTVVEAFKSKLLKDMA